MTNTYNTGNPLGSVAVKDLYDNASNLDEAMNSTSPAWQDRFGKRRETLAGLEQMVTDSLINSGFVYTTPLDYVAGIVLTAPNQIFRKDGEYYSIGPGTALPYTTTGVWASESNNFVSRGDAALRTELAGATGAALIPTTLRVVASVAALRLLTPQTQNVFVLGYSGAGTRGGGVYRPSPAGVAADNGGTVLAGPTGNWLFVGQHTVATFGAQGDGDLLGGGTDDTAAINRALAVVAGYQRLEFEPGRVYNVTSLTLSGLDYEVDFKGSTLYGIATVATDALLTLSDFSMHKLFNLQLRTDGNVASPVYHGNYGCAMRWKSSGGVSATQFVTIKGLRIWYFRQGIVNGNYVGDSPQPSATQSEIWVDDYQVRGVNRPFQSKLVNSYVTFTNSGFVAQQFEAASSWWVDADGWCARNDDPGSTVQFLACEFQRAIIAGFALYGVKMTVVDPVWEVSCPNYVAGDMTFRGGIDNYFGVAGVVPFQIPANATGSLLLDGFNLERPAGTANFDRARLVDASGNNSYRINLNNCRFKEWSFESPNAAGDFVHGGRLFVDNVLIDNSGGTATSFDLQPSTNIINNVDRAGSTMPTSSTTTAGGWTVYTGAANGAFGSNTTLPPGSSATMIIMTTNAGGTFGIATPTANGARIPVQGDKDYLWSEWLRIGAIASGSYQVFIDWYDFAGTVIGTSTVAVVDAAGAPAFSSNLRYRAGVHAPWNAASAVIRVTLGPSSTVRFSDMTLA